MAQFEVVAQEGLKMVRCVIDNETVRAESGALHYMRGKIEMTSAAPSVGRLSEERGHARKHLPPDLPGHRRNLLRPADLWRVRNPEPGRRGMDSGAGLVRLQRRGH